MNFRAFLSGLLFVLNTLFWCLLLYPFIFLKALVPHVGFKKWCTEILIRFGESWIAGNDLNMKLTQNIQWTLDLPPNLSMDRSYLISSNHQSWMDIVILQHVFNRRIPFLRFFLKQELIYVPLLGLAWWGLDYPFMKRYSSDYLRKHPEKRGEDLKATRKAVEKFRNTHVSILNFLEGTRFRPAKHQKQNSPYKHLLLPKAGGMAYVLKAMRDQLHSVLDVTIIYPQGPVSLGQALSGQLKEVYVHVREIPLPQNMIKGNYQEDPETRESIKAWVQKVWKEKDQLIEDFNSENPTP